MDQSTYVSKFIQLSGQAITNHEALELICHHEKHFAHHGQHLVYAGKPFGSIECYLRGETGFVQQLDRIWERFDEAQHFSAKPEIVRKKIESCVAVLLVNSIWPADFPSQEVMFERLDPIWDALHHRCVGLSLVDGGWFQDSTGLVSVDQ